MADKLLSKSNPDQPIEDFIKAGGRPNAESDFNRILQKAAPPIKPQSQKPKQ